MCTVLHLRDILFSKSTIFAYSVVSGFYNEVEGLVVFFQIISKVIEVEKPDQTQNYYFKRSILIVIRGSLILYTEKTLHQETIFTLFAKSSRVMG